MSRTTEYILSLPPQIDEDYWRQLEAERIERQMEEESKDKEVEEIGLLLTSNIKNQVQ